MDTSDCIPKSATDDENSTEEKENKSINVNNKYKLLLDSDSESDVEKETSVNKSSNKVNDDSDEESDNNTSKIAKNRIVSDSSDDEKVSNRSSVKDRRKNSNPKKKILPIKHHRKSASKAMEVIKKKIASKQETNVDQNTQIGKEREIRIPYHKPKQYTLKEFLSRKTLNKPIFDEEITDTTLAIKRANQNIDVLIEKMKEREKETLEFFKSESENDEKEPEQDKKIYEKISTNSDDVPQTSDNHVEKAELKSDDPELDKIRERYKNEPLPATLNLHEGNIEHKPSIRTSKTHDEMYSGDMIIDLETGLIQPKKLSGPEELRQRLFKTLPKSSPLDPTGSNIADSKRPCLARVQWKGSLQEAAKKESLELFKKGLKVRTKEEELELNEEKPSNLDEEDEVEKDDDESDEEIEAEDEEDDEEEQELIESKKKKNVCEFLDDEAVNEDESEDEEESSSSSSDEEETKKNEKSFPKKGRILKAFEEDSDDESCKKLLENVEENKESESENIESTENIQENQIESQHFNRGSEDLFSTQPSDFTFSEPSVSVEKKQNGISDLCNEKFSQPEDDDFMEILSGQFAPTQDDQVTEVPATEEVQEDSQFITQIDQETPTAGKVLSPIKNRQKLLESSDDEVEENIEEVNNKKKMKKKKKKRKQRTKKLGFSDDEEDNEENDEFEDEENVEDCEDEEVEEEEEEVLVDYDSEENEIEVKMKKKDRIKAASDYFEKEAELSDSEWGSADEDEMGMDKLELELGDEEQFDQEKLQEEVGRIHARKVLDDDIKNVKKLQDLLFEDDENDGMERERKFRWKNQTNDFAFDNDNARGGDDNLQDENDDEDDEQLEIQWRKERHERETLLREHALKNPEEDSDSVVLFDQDSQTVTTSSMSKLIKYRCSTSSSSLKASTTVLDKNSAFLIKASDMQRYKRSSFLARDDQTLKRIASFLPRKDDEISNLSSHGTSSMSFIPIEKQEDNKKRKSDGNFIVIKTKKIMSDTSCDSNCVLTGFLLIKSQNGFNIKQNPKKKRFVMLFARSSQGIERLEIADSETDKNPRIVTLENCIKVNSEPLPPAFLINVLTKSGQIVFQCTNETELNLWTKSLQSVAFNDKLAQSKRNSIVEYNELYCSSLSEGKFVCNLISTDITVKNKLEPKIYTLELTMTEIQLRSYDDDSVIVAKWPYRYIRKYGYRDGKFTFEAGRKCDTGEGTFKLDHANPQEIFRCMSSKMKSMKKLLNGDSSGSLDCGENQLNAALSMEAGSRSPLPPFINSPNSPDVEISITSHASLRGFLSSTDSINIPFLPGPPTPPVKNLPISIPNKPPRKTLHTVNSSDRLNPNFHETLVQLDSPPTPPERNKSMARDYECIENITEAWKTLGIDEPKHTEHVSTPEDELQEFAWQRSKSFNRNETRKISIIDINESATSVNNSNVSVTKLERLTDDDESDYDRLEFFPTSNKASSSSSGYKTIVPIVPPPMKKKPPVSDDYEIITPTELQSLPSTSHDIPTNPEPHLAPSRLADDSYLGYGVIRKTSLPQQQTSSTAVSFSSTSTTQTVVLSDEELLDHHKYNGLDYAIVSKPKRV
ncbi:CLUMA_CG009991, isoform A [Clunio marinus]|uniref:CLUMA_CG009991, isoform A n=1 Tax=Clunio marinus TaxID=568069 RepID=A0A1J1I843_9DIPT|nr:CLUMA_CG009991, isoform A [Clunio marinus]